MQRPLLPPLPPSPCSLRPFREQEAAKEAAQAAAQAIRGDNARGTGAHHHPVELKDEKTRDLLRQGAGRAAEDEEGYLADVAAGDADSKGKKVGFTTVPADQPRPAGEAESEYATELQRLEKARPGTQEHAELLALGTMMLKDSKAKEVVDNAYNRFAYPEDETELPHWFADDERRFNKPQMPVTAEMVARIRQRYTDLAEKPIKKVAEARDRKRRRLQAKVSNLKAKMANAMDDETTERTKLRAMQKAIASAKLKRPGKAYVVANSSGGAQHKGRKDVKAVVVDRRLKADKRGQKRAEQRKKGPKKNRKK